ncbi:MAG: VTT domain-containing protein [Balneolaceae bacterium]|nr:VTT domain-containing protein [Balneolaceae bacterium]
MKLFKQSFLRIFLLIYLLLMILSAIVQITFPREETINIYQTQKIVHIDEGEISLQIYELQNAESDEWVIFLPDLIMGSHFLIPLAEGVQNSRNVLIMDYPTQNTSGDRISHSVATRSEILEALISDLSYSGLHIAAHGYGGLIAVQTVSKLENKPLVNSLSLLSSYGPVEFHLLGNETINRTMYNLLYPAAFLFQYATPHFGWYHQQLLQNKNIRTYSEMEQANFREFAENVDLPVHIIHPLNDNYISYQTSVELHRILPHSTFAVAEVYQEKMYNNPGFWVDQLEWFWQAVERGEAVDRSIASADRIAHSMQPFDSDTVESHSGWPLLLIIVVIIILCFLNEDLTCISTGLLVAGGILDLHFAIFACFIGIFFTDSFAYYLGSRVGRPIFQKIPFKWIIDEKDVNRVEDLLRMHGMKVIFATRFIPGTRLPTYITAGMLKTDFKKFLAYFILATMVWAPLIVSLSAVLGRPMLGYIESYQEYAFIIVLLIVLIIYSLLKFILPLATITGRRRFIVKTERFKERYFG